MDETNSEVVSEKVKGYDTLTKEHQQLVDAVMNNLENGTGLWQKGWICAGIPENAVSGKKYRGVNNFFLTLVAMGRRYSDNRWLTYKQMESKGWSFKTDEEGHSLGRNAGVGVEFYELRDRETKQPFDRSVLDGMTDEEKEQYIKDNVYPFRRQWTVFNGDLIEGIPEREKRTVDESGHSDRAEKLIQLWSDTEAKILYDGSSPYYHRGTDRIHLPLRDDFIDLQEYYATALHEIGHSTGHEKRLNRNMGEGFSSPSYAVEELRAEIASLFIEQDLGIEVEQSHLQNNSAYIQSWLETIKNDPNVLFTAIADADKISKFVMSKEVKKEIEPYAIVEDADEYDNPIYKLYVASEYGQVRQPMAAAFNSREELMAEFGKMQALPFWVDKEFKEVSMDELTAASVKRAEEANKAEEVVEQPSQVYFRPSEIAAKATAKSKLVDMTGRGIESLTRMGDRTVVEDILKSRSGKKFSSLYNGISVLGNEQSDERSMLAQIATFTSDEEQIMRILQSSGQYRDEKPNAYYQRRIKEAVKFVSETRKQRRAQSSFSGSGKGGHAAVNAKS